jgi:hypothetical protein
MSVFQLPAQIRTVAQSYFFLEVTTSVVTTSDLDVLSNFKGTGCLICKINLLMEILALPHLNNEEPLAEKWDFRSRLFVTFIQTTSSLYSSQFPLVKEMLFILQGHETLPPFAYPPLFGGWVISHPMEKIPLFPSGYLFLNCSLRGWRIDRPHVTPLIRVGGAVIPCHYSSPCPYLWEWIS